MKGKFLFTAFTALVATSAYAHPRSPEPLHFQVSIDVAEVTEDPPTTYAVLLFAGTLLCPQGDSYTLTEPVNCTKFEIEEPDIEVESVTLHGFANCTIFTDSGKEYELVNYGLPSVTDAIDPPAVFVSGECCYPNEGDDTTKVKL
ncbi:MAG: hypothetical protein Q9195_005357 [Heterodermia aff. obscurata]